MQPTLLFLSGPGQLRSTVSSPVHKSFEPRVWEGCDVLTFQKLKESVLAAGIPADMTALVWLGTTVAGPVVRVQMGRLWLVR